MWAAVANVYVRALMIMTHLAKVNFYTFKSNSKLNGRRLNLTKSIVNYYI